jgi:hypothetical protein
MDETESLLTMGETATEGSTGSCDAENVIVFIVRFRDTGV